MSLRTRLRPVRGVLRRVENELVADWGTRRTLQRSAGLLRGAESPIGYLGFAGRGNAGDDSIMLAHERALAPARLAMLPIESERAAYAILGSLRRRALFRGVLLGGGTLLGRPQWRRRVESALAAAPGPLAVTGAGVEDPAFAGSQSYTDRDELARWGELLSRAAYVTVRGPRSAALLREVGVDAPVVSDSALLLAPDRPPIESVRPRLIAINVAQPEDQYSGTGSRVADACVDALRVLRQSGWHVRLLAFDGKDVAIAADLQRRLDGTPEIVTPQSGVDGLLRKIGECDVLIGQRLHSVVFAAAVGVPALAIDYRPKCRDFQESIGRGEWTVSTLDISARAILDAVARLHEERPHHVDEIYTAVLRARALLMEGERVVAQALALP